MRTNRLHPFGCLSAFRARRFGAIALVAVFLYSGPSVFAQSGPRGTVSRLRSAHSEIHAIAGRALVFQVEPASGEHTAWLPAGSHTVRTEPGGLLDLSIHFISAVYPFPQPGDWLNPSGRWNAITLQQAAARHKENTKDTDWLTQGFWLARVELPESARSQTLLLDGTRLPITWIDPPPRRTDPSREISLDAPTEIRRALGDRLRPYTSDPRVRWRIRLLTDRVRPATLWGNALPVARLAPPVLEEFASQIEDHWRAAIAAVERADPAAAARLALRLTTVALMPDGSLLPAWSHDDSGEAQLLSVLLDPALPVERHLAAAQAFVSAQPTAVAWVIDESAPSGNRPYASVAVTNLSDERLRCSATPVGARRPNTEPVEAHTSQMFVAVSDTADLGAVLEIDARAGDWQTTLAAIPQGIPASPPGVRMSPFVAPWSARAWLAQAPQAMPATAATAAMLFPEPALDAWRVYIECATPPVVQEDAGQSPHGGSRALVRLWFGPRGNPRAVIAVLSDGSAFDETHGSPLSLVSHGKLGDGAQTGVEHTGGAADGWWAMIRLPESVYEADGSLVMAIERIDANGLRSTWPRPVLPQQEEPGRVRVDLTAW